MENHWHGRFLLPLQNAKENIIILFSSGSGFGGSRITSSDDSRSGSCSGQGRGRHFLMLMIIL
jgi:hypothetical protein